MSWAAITGAAGGIGSAIARRLAGSAWNLVLIDLSPGLADIAAELENVTEVRPVQVDLTTDEGVEEVEQTVSANPPFRLLVNNAGITRDARLVNLAEDDVGQVLDVNLGSAWRLTTALAPHLENGAIVNISSRAYLGNFGQFNYSMSKGGLVGLTRALALQLAPRVRVNAVAPGLIGTEMSMAIPAEVRDKMVAAIPLQRMGTPEEMAELVEFLAMAEYITGEVVTIGGGRSLSR